MKWSKAFSIPVCAVILFLTACGRTTPVLPTATATPLPEQSPTSLPASTSTPAEVSTAEPTLDPHTVVPGGTVIVGIPREPDVLSPIMANEYMERILSWLFLEGLVQMDSRGEYVPVLGEALPAISEDGLVLTYTLKKGVLFSNGDPFGCADIVFTWKAVMSYFTPISKAGYELIKAVDCPDENTAVVSLSSSYPRYLQLFSFILPRTAGSLDAVHRWEYHMFPIGTGPWKILEWQVGSHVLLVRNEKYREPGKPYLESIQLKFLKSKESNLDLLAKGELDVAWGLGEGALAALDGLAAQGISYSTAPSGANEMLVFNLADPKIDAPVDASTNPHPILSDVRVRQAIGYAIDKGAIVDGLFGGKVTESSSILPSGPFACSLTPNTYDVDKGKALLDEAGWVVGSDGIREKEGLRLSLKFTTNADDTLRVQIQQAIVESVRAIGVELLVENVPSQKFDDSWKAGGLRKHGHFDILLLAGAPGINPANALKRDFHSNRIPTAYNQGAGNNISRYQNQEVDAWIDQSIASTNNAERQGLFCKIAEQINRDVPVLSLYEHLVVSAHLARLQNFSVSPGPANFTIGSQDWWLSP